MPRGRRRRPSPRASGDLVRDALVGADDRDEAGGREHGQRRAVAVAVPARGRHGHVEVGPEVRRQRLEELQRGLVGGVEPSHRARRSRRVAVELRVLGVQRRARRRRLQLRRQRVGMHGAQLVEGVSDGFEECVRVIGVGEARRCHAVRGERSELAQRRWRCLYCGCNGCRCESYE